MFFQMFLVININFLLSHQNKTPKTDPKMLKEGAVTATVRHALSFTQKNRIL